MWYKRFNKDSWMTRLWRNKNLCFKYNEFGFGASFYSGKLRNYYYRIFSHEAPLRVFNMFSFVMFISFITYYNKKYLAEGKE